MGKTVGSALALELTTIWQVSDFTSQGLFSNLFPPLAGFINEDNQYYRWKIFWESRQEICDLWIQVPDKKKNNIISAKDRGYLKLASYHLIAWSESTLRNDEIVKVH